MPCNVASWQMLRCVFSPKLIFIKCFQVLILRAWPRLTPKFQELIVKTMLLNCINLIRRDVNDHILVRFLPLVNECIASILQLEGLLSLAQCLESAQKTVGDITITSTKVFTVTVGCFRIVKINVFFSRWALI